MPSRPANDLLAPKRIPLGTPISATRLPVVPASFFRYAFSRRPSSFLLLPPSFLPLPVVPASFFRYAFSRHPSSFLLLPPSSLLLPSSFLLLPPSSLPPSSDMLFLATPRPSCSSPRRPCLSPRRPCLPPSFLPPPVIPAKAGILTRVWTPLLAHRPDPHQSLQGTHIQPQIIAPLFWDMS